MARPLKEGLDYFPMDVDFFEDDKIQLISSEFGYKGEYLTLRLLSKIYSNGYFYKWGHDESMLFAKRVGSEFSHSLVNDVVGRLVKRGFFDESIFNSFTILTSKGIQKRYFEACERRKLVAVDKTLLLIDVSKFINVHINGVSADINPQSKVEESKVKESRESTRARDEIFKIFIQQFSKHWPNECAKLDKEFESNPAIKKQLFARRDKIVNDALDKFWNHYEETADENGNWLTKNKVIITNRVAAFKKWLEREKQFKK